MLRFRTNPNDNDPGADVSVYAVHVYDGENLIDQYDDLRLAPENWSFERFQVRNNPAIRWGLGITIGVGFGPESASHRIDFSSVGCDFLE